MKKPKQLGKYIRQLVIDPDHQQKGIGKFNFKALLEKHPDTKHVLAVARKVNKPSIGLLKKLEFKESKYMREGYNSDTFIGFEYFVK